MNLKKAFWVILILAIVAGVVLYLQNKNWLGNLVNNEPKNTQPEVQVEINKVSSEDVGGKFPFALPVEAGSSQLGAYTGKLGDLNQISQKYTSSKTVEENFKIYSDLMTQNDWKPDYVGGPDNEILIVMSQKPDQRTLQFVLAKNSAGSIIEAIYLSK